MAAFPLQARLDAPDWAPRRPRTAAARRDWRWLANAGDEIAFEIALLADQGVARASRLAATRAADSKIWADEALLGEGHMREDAFYRLLARHVGLPYYRGDIAIAECRNPAEAAARGSVRLAPNSQGLRAVLAPR